MGFGDWQEVIAGLPHYPILRIAMCFFGAVPYYFVVKMITRLLEPFCPGTEHRELYNTLTRLPY